MQANGSLLAQERPSGTTDTTAFTAQMRTEITCIYICNSTGSAVSARIFHDDDGSTYSQANALFYDKSIPANDTLVILTEGIGSVATLKKDGTIGIRTGTANALTFSIYGVTESRLGPSLV